VTTYRLDELAAATGVPARTIRYYQSNGLLPKPAREGKVAVYGDEHHRRLELIADMRDRGLQLDAIRDVLAASARTRDSVASWLGLAQLRAAWVPERREAQLSDDELADLVGGRLPEVLDQLVAAGYLSAVSDGGGGRRWRVPDLPRLQRVLDLHAAGIDVELSIAMAKLLRRRLARLADDLVEMLASELLRQYGDQVEAPVEAVEVLRTVAVETTGEALVEEITYALDRLRVRQQNGS